ncbi:hypothetical protein A2U01_0093852 [Trifolium medium]|uniref:Uncharacterized protein n=1 Tax=Trifolium medium TaxID=97028 RepID=A0A392UGA3_9FABA|nr:hypothetical protein [Trifolium medium]
MLGNKTVPSEQTDGRRYSTSVTLLPSRKWRRLLSWLSWCFRSASVTSTWILKRFDFPRL